jgi:hypothetical protein
VKFSSTWDLSTIPDDLLRAEFGRRIKTPAPRARVELPCIQCAHPISARDENVFTFSAWKAVGRRVKKGQHGVKAVTFVPVGSKEDKETGEKKAGYRMPRTVTVFHVSQTEPETGDL